MERPAKRRRVSKDDDVPRSESHGSDGSTSSHGELTAGVQIPNFDTDSTLSRIKSKKATRAVVNSTQTENAPSIPDSAPATISLSTDTNDKTTFATLGTDPWLNNALRNMSITQPTRIQKACIPAILSGQDCIGGSRTGSGKTVAFTIPILQHWGKDPSGIFAVILTPTRELALQIYEQVAAIGVGRSVRCCLVTGGADMRTQALELSKRPHVVVATPGRLRDHIENSGEETICGLRRVKYVVMDEADRLLASGKGSMLDDLETCLEVFPPAAARQTCLFTATVTPEVRALKEVQRAADRRPVFVCEVDIESLAVPKTLRQTYQLANVIHKEKYLHILLLTPANSQTNTIIFCNRTTTANLLEHLLRLLNHRVTSLHSGLKHEERTSNLARFRARAARILVATDVAARGLDIPDVGLVINYDLPRNPDDYIHRVGRTARAGRKGTSISLVGQRDVDLVHAIEARVGGQMVEYEEDKVSVESRVLKDALNVVGEKKREALLNIEEGRDVKGNRTTGMGSLKRR